LKESYVAGIQYTDGILQNFFDDFETNYPDIYANTLIIISAEHGEDLEEHNFIFHRDLYDVNTHVPLAFIFPKALRPQSISDPVSLIDLTPTILDFAGVQIEQDTNFEGRTLLELIGGKKEGFIDRYLYAERAPFDEFAVWKGSYKYILRNPSLKAYQPTYPNLMRTDYTHADLFFTHMRKSDIAWSDELYNTEFDPLEQRNLIGTGLPIETELRNVAKQFAERMGKERLRYFHTQVPEPIIPLTYP
jgi:arylsulfatase A-like enzyme